MNIQLVLTQFLYTGVCNCNNVQTFRNAMNNKMFAYVLQAYRIILSSKLT